MMIGVVDVNVEVVVFIFGRVVGITNGAVVEEQLEFAGTILSMLQTNISTSRRDESKAESKHV
jgi:hypothetical protein